MRTVAIIGNPDTALNHAIALNEAAQSIGVKLIHLNDLKMFEETPDPFFVPKTSFEFTIKGRSEDLDDLKIFYDKYGKPLTNPGSKFHK